MGGMLVDELFDELNDAVTWTDEGDYSAERVAYAFERIRNKWAAILAQGPSHYDDPRWLAQFAEVPPDEHGGADYRITLDVWISIHQDDTDDNQYVRNWRQLTMDERIRHVALEKVIDSIQGGSVEVDNPGDMKVVWLPRDE